MAESGNDESVTRNYRAEEGPAAGRGFHFVLRSDVVLDKERDAVKWSADEASSTFGVEDRGDAEEVGVYLEYCAWVWSVMLGIRFTRCDFGKEIKG